MHACIVTCGGLCPGLNTVIREIVCGLNHMYGVTRILGIDVSEQLSLLLNRSLYLAMLCIAMYDYSVLSSGRI